MSDGDGPNLLKPFVHWGQNKQYIFVRVELTDIENFPQIEILEDSLSFKAHGVGVSGKNLYGFTIDLYQHIDLLKSRHKTSARGVEIELRKVGTGEKWPRLTESAKKIVWLKTDFDRFAFDSSDESSENEGGFSNNRMSQTPSKEMMDKFEREFKEAEAIIPFDTRKQLKTIYLMMYNMFQWIGFSYVFTMMLVKLYYEGPGTRKSAFSYFGPQMMVCQTVAVMEIFHSLFGWVKSGLTANLMQVFGRGFVLFTLIAPEPKLHDREVVWFLFLTWSSVELIRYPYYMLALMNRELGLITWLRYTIWIVLYPLGFLFEGIIMLMAIPLFEESQRFNYPLPNPYNISFHFTSFLKFYMLYALPGLYVLMQRMYEQRKKKMNTKDVKRKKLKSQRNNSKAEEKKGL